MPIDPAADSPTTVSDAEDLSVDKSMSDFTAEVKATAYLLWNRRGARPDEKMIFGTRPSIGISGRERIRRNDIKTRRCDTSSHQQVHGESGSSVAQIGYGQNADRAVLSTNLANSRCGTENLDTTLRIGTV